MEDKRKHQRYKAIEGLNTTIQADDSTLHTEGIVLNISKNGAYVLADSIPFQTGQVTFRFEDGTSIKRICRRTYPHQSKARGQAVAFTESLNDEELDALKAPAAE